MNIYLVLGERSTGMNNLRARFTESSSKSTAIETYKLGFSLLTALTDLFIKWRVIFTKFVGNLFLLGLHLFVVDFTVLLVCADLLDVSVDD